VNTFNDEQMKLRQQSLSILLKNFGPRLIEKDWIYENKNINRI